jgi:acylphosphatase
MESGTRIAFWALSFLIIALASGCAHSAATAAAKSPGKLFAVTADTTPFYHYGPSQGSGPDKTIPRNTPVKLIRSSLGYCKVQLLTGEQGYVARDDIGKASADVIAATLAPANPITTVSRSRGDSPEPRLNTFEPLPEFEPTPIPTPSN